MLADLDSVGHMKTFFNSIGTNSFYADFIDVNADFRSNYLMNSMLVNLENNTHFVFFCLNTRLESPILNSRLRKLSLLNENIKFYGFGLNSSYLNLPISLYGNSVKKLLDILNFRSELSRDLLFNSYNYSIFNLNDVKKQGYMFFFGLSFFQFYNGSYLLDVFKNWINKNFVLNYAVVFPFVGYLSYFEVNGSNNNFLTNKKNFIYLNNVDDKNFLKTFNKSKNYVVYHGSFFSDGAEIADLLIPLHSVFENNYKYINIEGRIRKSLTVLNYNNNNITTEVFFRFLSIIMKTYLPHNYSNINNFNQVTDYFKFVEMSVPFVTNQSFLVETTGDIFPYRREHLLTED
jgi:NADH dehydrogenase (ubiquinone) Fe-S protein 1